ncbi:Leucyl/phenylalanyl-tRNA--protein transferase [Trichinella pseudospiralis]
MIVVGARSLNPLGVRHIGLECLGQGSAAHLCCLRRSVWLLLIVFVSIRDQWPVGWLAVAHLRPSQISGMFTVLSVSIYIKYLAVFGVEKINYFSF